ncbi:hypothetical protein CIPAW_02G048400 [Carya illinoinensis]|uniref:Uncharacterized protein n=1 Tax=Carya illinoinensis TaxID=32201 RepID=A0A8T1R8R3_CARIL|nr:hypothetical protein CIPAW_02G048400 [Carya illinoinensis]
MDIANTKDASIETLKRYWLINLRVSVLDISVGLYAADRVLRGSRKCTGVDDFDRRSLEVKSWSSSPQASPEQRFADMESSIHEAVLHCKRSTVHTLG